MSLKQDLKNLRSQKKQELNRLHYTYLRTKRDLKRQVSPDRFVRRHLGASLGLAGVAGFLFAPRPSSRISEREIEKAVKKYVKEGRPARNDSFFARLQHALHSVLGQLQHLVPDPKAGQPGHAPDKSAPPKPSHPKDAGAMPGLLGWLLTLLVSRVDLTRLISELSRNVMGKAAGHHKGNGHTPRVSVADVGTVKPDQMEDFQ